MTNNKKNLYFLLSGFFISEIIFCASLFLTQRFSLSKHLVKKNEKSSRRKYMHWNATMWSLKDSKHIYFDSCGPTMCSSAPPAAHLKDLHRRIKMHITVYSPTSCIELIQSIFSLQEFKNTFKVEKKTFWIFEKEKDIFFKLHWCLCFVSFEYMPCGLLIC